MKVNKNRLKQIIKEELGKVTGNVSGADVKTAEALVPVFEQSPEIMAAVEQAIQEPEVRAALEQALEQAGGIQEGDVFAEPYKQRADTAQSVGFQTMLGGLAGGAAIMATPSIMSTLGASATFAALGFTAGPALIAVGVLAGLAMYKHGVKMGEKGRMPHKREYQKDFSPEELERIRGGS